MNLRAQIYDAILRDQSKAEVLLADVIKIGCLYRHYLKHTGKTRSRPERAQDFILQEVGFATRSRFSGYFAETFNEYAQGYWASEGPVTYMVDGFVGDTLLEIYPVSTLDYSQTKAPNRAVLSAATKAYLQGSPEALLVVVDRDKQAWSFWRVSGDLENATKEIVSDIRYLEKLVANEAVPVATASESTCRRCPYQGSCTLVPSKDPPPYSVRTLKTQPAVEEQAKVEKYLWSLNAKPSHRKRNVIHPSEFSITDCDRRIAYGLMGTEEKESIDPKLRRIFDTGHACHDVIQSTISWAIPEFRDEVPVRHDDLKIAGHCDGDLGGGEGVEIKSIGSNGFGKLKKAKKDHEKQATLYGALLDLKKIQYIYINKETGDLAVFQCPVDRQLWHKMAGRAANIVKTVDDGMLPPQITQEYKCKTCKYAWTCKPELSEDKKPRSMRKFSR